FRGYKRDNGRVGVRNHVLVLPVDDLSNAACEAVANNIKGTLAIPHPYGRLQFGPDLELHFKTLIGTGSNPNVAAAVVVGIEDGWARRVADGIAATGKPVSFFGIEGHGDTETIRRASKAAKEYMQWASELHREERPLKDLWVPTKCNIAGGLTTIEEKALGNIQKIGKKCMVDGVLDKAEVPSGPGLWFMDSSSAAAEMVTLCAASGYVVHFFPTGQCNVIGNPI